jgi:outer membrane protein assembly factor BamB
MRRPTGNRPLPLSARGALAALALAAVASFMLTACGGSSGSTQATRTQTVPAPTPPKPTKRVHDYIAWPLFGRLPERTHYLPVRNRDLAPPLKEAWSVDTHGLIEFPPAIANGVAYVVNKYGNAQAIRLRDRKVLWRRLTDPEDKGNPTDVTAPTYHRGKVYFAFLDGDLVAIDAHSGRLEWKAELHSHLESSPLAVNGRLYIGTDTTDVVALRASDGKFLWRFDSPGAIKSSPSFHRGRIFVADYQGAMFSLDARTGRPLWRTNTTRVPPFGEGGFYSSPSIAFGQVYAARDDGTVYAFDERTGRVNWAFPTGAFIYGSPAAARVPGTPPTIYIGSENSRFYAIDARTGRLRWHYDVGGPVPGTAVVIDHTVYTSSFRTHDAIGIDVRTHRKVFQLDSAGYTPAVSDGRHLYLVGYFALYGLEPAGR